MSDNAPNPEELEELRVEIRYLTSALSGRSLSVAEEPSRPSSDMKAQLVGFTHLSHLLCLGLRSCPAVAVTGTIESEQVSLVVFAPNSLTDDQESGPNILQEIVPEPESSDGPSLFTQAASTPPSTLVRNAQLCLLGLRLFQQGRITGGNLHRWFLAYGHSELRRRLGSVIRSWEGDAVTILQQLDFSQVNDTLQGTVICSLESNLRTKIRAVVPELLTKTEEDDEQLETIVDRSTAAAWTSLLAACLRGIGQAMGVLPFSETHKISATDIADAHWWMHILFSIVNSSAIIALFSHPSISVKFNIKISLSLPEAADADAVPNEEEVDILKDETIPNGAKFLRHLATLASWYSGIYYFQKPRGLAENVRMQIVRVAEPSRENERFRAMEQSVLARVADRIRARAPKDSTASIPPGDTLEDLIKQLRSPADTSQVHCEASIMGFVVQRDPELRTSGWAIGVSKKCCWTCWKLGELLGTTFAMNGTHKTVYGWVPPGGLPVGVLERLRDALWEAYANTCWAELKRRRGQTSPMFHVLVKEKLTRPICGNLLSTPRGYASIRVCIYR
ncbi:hypothetical protein C8R44DRAFT_975692 [Mycena epipterygia]|nr:hypothetical protein C8R44DRAFT_975692 [Mycena epipterygia]